MYNFHTCFFLHSHYMNRGGGGGGQYTSVPPPQGGRGGGYGGRGGNRSLLGSPPMMSQSTNYQRYLVMYFSINVICVCNYLFVIA